MLFSLSLFYLDMFHSTLHYGSLPRYVRIKNDNYKNTIFLEIYKIDIIEKVVMMDAEL